MFLEITFVESYKTTTNEEILKIVEEYGHEILENKIVFKKSTHHQQLQSILKITY